MAFPTGGHLRPDILPVFHYMDGAYSRGGRACLTISSREIGRYFIFLPFIKSFYSFFDPAFDQSMYFDVMTTKKSIEILSYNFAPFCAKLLISLSILVKPVSLAP